MTADGEDPNKKAAALAAAAALPDAPPETFPRAFGNYMLLAPIARGGMGEVFLAKHGSVAGLEKHCVLKTLRPHLTDDREYTTRFIDEARIVVQLGHRNICHVFDVGTVGERYYLAMEFISGKDLRTLGNDVAEKGGVVHPGLALHIVCEVLEALDYAHRHVDANTGAPLLLVHRDVSPQNVMLSYEGECKLIDFGLAASTLKMEHTSPNVVMGKLAYMAPEQVRGEKVDGRADLFAVGVMLYEMLRGERFYDGHSPYEIWGLAAQGGFRPRSWRGLDDEMRAILERALAGKVDERFATCMELRDALTAYRYAHGLHGDAPMLRSLMHQVYLPEIEESRRVLVALSRAKPSDSGPQQSAWRVSTEPTISLARSPSASLEHKRALAAQRALKDKEGTGPTNMYPKGASARRRPSLIAAAAALLTIAAGTAAVAQFVHPWDSSSSNVSAPPPAAATNVSKLDEAVARSGMTAPTATAPTAPTAATATATAANATVQPAVVEETEPSVSSSARERRRGKRERARVALEEKAPAEAPPVPPVVEEKPAPPPPVVEKPVERVPTFGSLSPARRAEELSKRCASLSCASVAKVRFGELGPEALRDWKSDVEKCWRQCSLPF